MKKLLLLLCVFLVSCNKENLVVKQQLKLQYQGINTDTVDYGSYNSNLDVNREPEGIPHYIGGTHFFWPSYTNYYTTQTISWITFMGDAVYDLGDAEEQLDFNKLPGLRKALLGSSTKNSCMVGWRWCIEHGKLEYSPFINDQDGGFYCFGHQQVINEQLQSPLNVQIRFEVQNFYDHFEVTIGDRWYSFNKAEYNVKNFSNSYWVNFWWGGTLVAPHDVHLQLN